MVHDWKSMPINVAFYFSSSAFGSSVVCCARLPSFPESGSRFFVFSLYNLFCACVWRAAESFIEDVCSGRSHEGASQADTRPQNYNAKHGLSSWLVRGVTRRHAPKTEASSLYSAFPPKVKGNERFGVRNARPNYLAQGKLRARWVGFGDDSKRKSNDDSFKMAKKGSCMCDKSERKRNTTPEGKR